MMPLSLFGSPSFVGLTLFTLLLYGALGGLFVLVPYVLIQAGQYTATQAGAALLPLPLVIAVASPAAGTLAAKVGPRWLLITGPVIIAAGFLLTLRIGSVTSYRLGVFPAMSDCFGNGWCGRPSHDSRSDVCCHSNGLQHWAQQRSSAPGCC
jgi:predicted MFS family arabinose efflux permease